jgi:hypothetical protein
MGFSLRLCLSFASFALKKITQLEETTNAFAIASAWDP